MNSYFRKISSTNLFLVPLFGVRRDKLVDVGFIEAFIRDEIGAKEYENAVYMLFRPCNRMEEFNKFVEEQREGEAPIIDEYDLPDGFTILVYKLAKRWAKDIERVVTGKFSELSLDFMQQLPRWSVGSVDGEEAIEMLQWLIYTKNDKLKDYWKKELDLTITNSDQHWHHYGPDREVLTEKILNKYNYE